MHLINIFLFVVITAKVFGEIYLMSIHKATWSVVVRGRGLSAILFNCNNSCLNLI